MTGEDFRELMDAMADPLVACDGDERVLYLNAAAGRLLGWTLEELRGQPFARLLPERLRSINGHSFLRYLSGRRQALGYRPAP